MPLMKSLGRCRNVRLLATLASLNNDHNSKLRAYYAGMKSSSGPNFVRAKPLHLRSAAWRSSIVMNLSNTTSRRVPIVEVEARTVVGRCCVVVTTLARSLISPYNTFVLSYCISSFSISPSLTSKPVKHRLSLSSSYLGASTRVSTTRLIT
jgi:hypothetical protein